MVMRQMVAGVLGAAALVGALLPIARTQTIPSHDGWDSGWHDWWHSGFAPARHTWDGWLHDWWHVGVAVPDSATVPDQHCRIVTTKERLPDGDIVSRTSQQC
jgi:hypothetical protein